MQYSNIQPKSLKKHHHKHKVVHTEIQHKKTHDQLSNNEWLETMQIEIHQFELAIVIVSYLLEEQVDSLFREAEETETVHSLGSFKLAKKEHTYIDEKSSHLRELATTYQGLLTEENKILDKTTKEYKLLLNQLIKQREILEFQFNISQRILVLIQVYIKLKNQYQDQGELQKHRDYILSKIDKIKQSEEKHVKKVHKTINNEDSEEQEIEEEEEEEQEEEVHESATEQLIKLCDSLISYLSNIEITEEDHLLHHDLATLQFFDQIHVGLPFHSKYVKKAIELIQARKAYYQNAQESELIVQPEVKQQKLNQQLDIDSEKEFPKLS